MNPKSITAIKIAAIILIGMCVTILFSVNKYSASIVLTVSAIVILLPKSKSKKIKWIRVIFLILAVVFVLWNVSTTDLPRDHYETGFWYFDKVAHIFNGFLKNVFGIGYYQGKDIYMKSVR